MNQPKQHKRTATKKRRRKIVVLSAIPLVLASLVLAAYYVYKAYKNPERFIATAVRMLEESEYKAAQDQYNRALRFSRSGAARADVARRMIKVIEKKSPLPVKEARDAWQMIQAYRSHIMRFDPKEGEIRSKVLSDQIKLAQHLGAAWAWQQAAELADVVLLTNPDNKLAAKAKTVARLFPVEQRTFTEKDFIEIRDALRDLQAELPHDPDIPYYIAYTLMQQASLLDQEYLEDQRARLFEEASKVMNECRNKYPDHALTVARQLKLGLFRIRQQKTDHEFARKWVANLKQAEMQFLKNPDTKATIEIAGIIQTLASMQEYGFIDDASPLADLERETLKSRTIALCEAALSAAPDDLSSIVAMASVNRHFGETKAAREYLEQALRPDIEVPLTEATMLAVYAQTRARFLLADILLEMEAQTDAPETGKQLRKKVEANLDGLRQLVSETNPYLVILEGRIAYLDGEYREAVTKLQDANKAMGRHTPQAVLFAGLSFSQLGETGAAVEQLSRYLSIPGTTQWTRTQALKSLLTCAIRLREFGQAVKIGKRLVEENPGNIDANLALGEALILQLVTGGIDNQTDRFAEVLSLLEPLAEQGNSRAVRQLAQVHAAAGNLDEARELLIDYCSKNPQNGSALAQLYEVATASGKQEEAVAKIRAALATFGESNRATKYLRAALDGEEPWTQYIPPLLAISFETAPVTRQLNLYRFLRQVGRQDEADTIMTALMQKHPNEKSVIEAQFYNSAQQKDWQTAQAMVEAMRRNEDDPLPAALLAARLALAQGNPGDAVTALDPVLTEDVKHSNAWNLLGVAYQQQGDLYQAQVSLEKALTLKPDNLYTLRQLIAVCDARGFNYQALDYMRKALRFAPRDDNMLRTFLNYLERYNNPDQALDLRLRLASVRPDDPENRRAIARLFLRTAQPEKALAVLNKLIADYPNDFNNIMSQAEFYVRVGQPDRARQIALDYLQSDQRETTARQWVLYANLLMQSDASSMEEVQQALDTAVSREDKGEMTARRARAQWNLVNGRPQKALQEYRTLYEQFGTDQLMVDIAKAYIALEDFKNAYDAITGYLSTNNLTAEIAALKAHVEINLDKTADANNTLDAAVKLAPGNPTVYLMRARLNSMSSEPAIQQQVREDLEKALDLNPNYVMARQLLAEWLYRHDRAQEAIAEVKRLLVRNPANPGYREMLANLYLSEGDTAALRTMLDEWDDVVDDKTAVTYWQARLAQAQEKWDVAAQRLAEIYKDHPRFRREYINALIKSEQYDAAIQQIDDATKDGAADHRLIAMKATAVARKGDQDAALALFMEAWQKAPADFAHKNMVCEWAQAPLDLEHWETFLTQIAAGDDTHIAKLRLARLDMLKGSPEEAIQRLEKLRQSIQEDNIIYGRVLLDLGNAYTSAKQHDKAQYYLMAASDKLPDDASLLNNLAYEMALVGKQPYKAIEFAERALALIGSNDRLRAHALDTLGFAQYRANLLAHAETSLDRSIKTREMPHNYMHMGQVYLAQNKPAQARKALENAQRLTTQRDQQDIGGEIAELLKEARALEKELQEKEAIPEG